MCKQIDDNKKEVQVDYEKEYNELFSIIGINSKCIKHEWNNEGDVIKEFDLYEKHPNPVLSSNTFSINY